MLKSTGSAFENFVRDEYTTLAEVDDRIFSTSVDLRYTYGQVNVQLPGDEKRLVFGVGNLNGGVHPWEDAKVGARSREITLDVFAQDESASVQVRGNQRGIADRQLTVTLIGMVADSRHWSGDAIQDGTTGAGRERGGGYGAVRAAKQALYPGGHEVHWGGQHDAVRTNSLFSFPDWSSRGYISRII